ncbi:MAG: tetratricopeptide repeat protein [Enterobacterales bacterium]|nr:tetratricopeptide repeat protein [Enterobacterales bacterium]
MSRAKLLILFAVVLLASCKQQYNAPINTSSYLHDELFPSHLSVVVETGEQVFAINDDMKKFVNRRVKTMETKSGQIRELAEGIFRRSNTDLLYQNDANTVATETFANQAANCLSLTIMTYALADYAGFGVSFQQVMIPELWVRRDSTSLLNRHVNLKLFEKPNASVVVVNRHDFEVDFNILERKRRYPKRIITKERVLAMFYNNKGVDALIDENHDMAYAYFKKGILTDAYLVDNYTNLGIMYRRLGHHDYAEQNYTLALKIEPGDGTTLENLAALYTATGRHAEAVSIQRELQNKRLSNPYYHYLLGEQALEKNELLMARKHFRRAIDLHRSNHEFYFAMARTLYLLGDKKGTQRYLNLARKHSETEQEELHYAQKLNSFSQLQ